MKIFSFLRAVSSLLMVFIAVDPCFGLSAGQQAPEFKLNNTQGETFSLAQMKDRPMTILYFFAADSPPSQEGLLSLAHLVKKYPEIDMEVRGITLSAKERAVEFMTKTQQGFPVLLDDSGVSDRYNARKILPTIYILGPELKVLDVIQGGGKATEVMLVRLAERALQRKKTQLVKSISEEVEKTAPENLEAISLRAYAALKAGNLKEAERIFAKLAGSRGQGEILGNEGLVMVYAKQGEDRKALSLAEEVEQKAPERAFVHVAKGDVLFRQGKKAQAEAEYQKAVARKDAASYQRALALNQLGRISAEQGNYQKAHDLYDQAVELDPFYVEAMTNKGITYGKQGRWEDALQVNRKAMSIEGQDTFAAVLAKHAENMVALQRDTERRNRLDGLVKELVKRYRTQEESRPGEDSWTSGPMVMTFIDFAEKGGLAEQDGLAMVLTTKLGEVLNDSGRVGVVERTLVDRLFEELNIGSSALADPDTALKVGRILAAKLIGTGSLFHLPETTLLNLRLVDTETSAIQKVFTLELGPQDSLDQELFRLNRETLRTIMEKYPLQGFVVEATGEQVMINLGEKQGVVQGTTFEVLQEQEARKYKGKILRGSPRVIGQIEILAVESDLSTARIVASEEPLKSGQKVKEKLLTQEGLEERPIFK